MANTPYEKIVKKTIENLESGKKTTDKMISDLLNSHPKTLMESLKKPSKFWYKEPVPKLLEHVSKDGEIFSIDKLQSTILKEQQILPENYEWVLLSLDDDSHLDMISDFIQDHYIENEGSTINPYYAKDYIKWTLSLPSYNKSICLGIQSNKKKLVGFISAIFVKMQANQHVLNVAEIKFLCVHNKLRNKSMAPVLIREIKRYIKDINQAFYTSERFLPKPFVSITNHHRPLNFVKLLETGFCTIDEKDANDLDRIKTFYKPTEDISSNYKSFDLLSEEQIHECYDLLIDYLEKYNVYQLFSLEQFKYMFTNNRFVKAYGIFNNDSIVDMVSVLFLPEKITDNRHKFIYNAHIFYYTSMNETIYSIIRNTIQIVSKLDNGKYDVVTITDALENSNIITELKFIESVDKLHYYFFNWLFPDITNQQVGKLQFP